MPLSDWQIEQLVKDHNMIHTFVKSQSDNNVISYGCSSYGYDARLGYKFKVFTDAHCTEIDPKGMDPRAFVDLDLTPAYHYWVHDTPNGQIFHCVRCNKWTHHIDIT